jgi:hypothetical protein
MLSPLLFLSQQHNIDSPANEPTRKASVRHWTDFEDQLLLRAVSRWGTNDWTRIAHMIGNGRSRSQCSQRWFRCIDPRIRKGRWEPEEDEVLLAIVEKYEPKNWVHISREMKTRTDVQCRHRYLLIMRQGIHPLPQRIILPPIESVISRATELAGSKP